MGKRKSRRASQRSTRPTYHSAFYDNNGTPAPYYSPVSSPQDKGYVDTEMVIVVFIVLLIIVVFGLYMYNQYAKPADKIVWVDKLLPGNNNNNNAPIVGSIQKQFGVSYEAAIGMILLGLVLLIFLIYLVRGRGNVPAATRLLRYDAGRLGGFGKRQAVLIYTNSKKVASAAGRRFVKTMRDVDKDLIDDFQNNKNFPKKNRSEVQKVLGELRNVKSSDELVPILQDLSIGLKEKSKIEALKKFALKVNEADFEHALSTVPDESKKIYLSALNSKNPTIPAGKVHQTAEMALKIALERKKAIQEFGKKD